MASTWSYSFAFGDGESDSENEDATTTKVQQMQGVQFTEPPVEQELSEDTRLARELDLSTRKDTAIFRKTPWTVAKTNAASRPAIKPSIPSILDPHALKSSNGSFLTTENTKRPKQALQKDLTDHFRRGSNRKETSGPTVERARTRPNIQEIVVTRPASPKKREPSPEGIRSLPQKQTQPPHRRPFISPLKNLLPPPPYVPNSPRPPKQPATSKVEVLAGPAPPESIAPNPRKVASIASTTPDRLNVKKETIGPTIKRETVTPTTKKAGDTFRASTPLVQTASFTPLKRKRESSPTELSAALPQRSSSPAPKRVLKEESPRPRKPVRTTIQGAPVYGNGAFSSNDEQWSTLPTRKKPKSMGVKNPSSSRLTTGGFRLPTSFLGVPKNVENVQGSVRPKRTLLTLYQPPPPLPSTRSRKDVAKEIESTSDPSEESGSGESDGSAVERIAKFASPEDQEGNFRFSYPGVDPIIEKDDQDTFFAREGVEALDESDLIASIDSVVLRARFPRLVNGLRERHRVLRVPLSELLGMDSCGVVWDDEWTEGGDAMRIPVLPLESTDGHSDVPD